MRMERAGGPGTGRTVRWGTSPKILEEAEKTAKSAMTDGFVKRLTAYAREDAKRGDYMSGGCILMQREQMRQYVSPDRAGPMAQVTSAIQEVLQEPDPLQELLERLLDKLAGKCSGRIQIRPEGQSAEVRAPNGEVIASYNSLGGGWTEIRTKAENKFLSEVAAVYGQAFREARAEMRAAQSPPPVQAEEPAVDIRA